MWSLISSNKILERKTKQQAHQKHLRNLRNIKSSINNSSPRKYSFLSSRPKARQLREQKNNQICHSNNILVGKMLSTHSSFRNQNIHTIQSLRVAYNKKKQRQIDIDNQILVKMLQNATSQYTHQDVKKYTDKYLRLRSNVANSRIKPFYDLQVSKRIIDTRRPSSAKK